jgi:transposase-like protein
MPRYKYDTQSKIEAIRRVVEAGHRVEDVARHIGASKDTVYFWLRRYRELERQGWGRADRQEFTAPRARSSISLSEGAINDSSHEFEQFGTLVAHLHSRRG